MTLEFSPTILSCMSTTNFNNSKAKIKSIFLRKQFGAKMWTRKAQHLISLREVHRQKTMRVSKMRLLVAPRLLYQGNHLGKNLVVRLLRK